METCFVRVVKGRTSSAYMICSHGDLVFLHLDFYIKIAAPDSPYSQESTNTRLGKQQRVAVFLVCGLL